MPKQKMYHECNLCQSSHETYEEAVECEQLPIAGKEYERGETVQFLVMQQFGSEPENPSDEPQSIETAMSISGKVLGTQVILCEENDTGKSIHVVAVMLECEQFPNSEVMAMPKSPEEPETLMYAGQKKLGFMQYVNESLIEHGLLQDSVPPTAED